MKLHQSAAILLASLAAWAADPPAARINYFHGKDARLWRRDVPAARTSYATFLGGNANDHASAVATDPAGNIYVAGYTSSPDLPVTADAIDNSISGGDDVFVAKFNPQGGLIYCTYLGGHGVDRAFGIAVDPHGNAYITGQTASVDFPTTPGAILESSGGTSSFNTPQSVFVTKLNAAGNAILYSTLLGSGTNADTGKAIAVDASGSVFVTGINGSADFFATPGALTPKVTGNFLARLNVAGARYVYATSLPYAGDTAAALAIDSAGNAYVTGSTYEVAARGPGALQATNGARLLFKTADSGAHWSSSLTGLEHATLNVIATDPGNGSVVYAGGITGLFKSVDAGESFVPVFTSGRVSGIAVDPGDSNHLLLVADFIRYVSRDAGLTWTSKGPGGFTTVAFDPAQPSNVYGYGFSSFYYSRNGGEGFNQSIAVPRNAFGWTSLAIDPFNSNNLAASLQSLVVRSFDAGVTWQAVTAAGIGVSRLVADPKNVSVLFGTSSSTLQKSTDGGFNWKSTPLPAIPAGLTFGPDGTTLYILTANGIYQTTDGGVTVTAMPSQPLNANVSSLSFDLQHPGVAFALSFFGNDVFVTKVSADGTAVLFSTYFGGAATDTASAIALDAAGNIYIAGTSNSPDLPGARTAYHGGGDAFVAKLSNDGSTLLYSTLLGGTQSDTGNGIAVDASGNVVVVGLTWSADYPLTADALQRTAPVNTYIGYYARLDAIGGVLSSSYLGGTLGDLATAVAMDPSGRACIVGDSNSTDFKTTSGAVQPARNGFTDTFLAIVEFGP